MKAAFGVSRLKRHSRVKIKQGVILTGRKRENESSREHLGETLFSYRHAAEVEITMICVYYRHSDFKQDGEIFTLGGVHNICIER